MSQDQLAQYTTYLFAVIGAASAAAAYFPPGKPGTVWYQVRTVIDFLGHNFLNAKNAEPKA